MEKKPVLLGNEYMNFEREQQKFAPHARKTHGSEKFKVEYFYDAAISEKYAQSAST